MMHTKKRSVSIIGCGWLGKPLSQSLETAYDVSCFTRKTEEANLDGYFYNPPKESAFWNCEYTIIAISTKDDYLKTLEKLALRINANATIILMSSTSVYKEYDCEVDEKSPITHSSQQYEAELLMASLREKLVILRLGGLMGEDRISGRWSRVSLFTDGPVNYVYRDDVISVVETILSHSLSNDILNVVAPLHPLRSIIHAHNAKKFDFKMPAFEGTTKRKVNSKHLINSLKYSFKYPDPLKFW